MRATSTLSPVRQGRRRLLGSCAIAAGLAALALGGPARAQVAGTGQIVSGSGTIAPPQPLGPTAPPNSTQVQVTGPETIINWTPTDSAPTGGAIDFLPEGNTLEFYGTGQYTVLNRFVDAGGGSIGRQVALNGTVNSYIGSPFATGGNAQGGSIWFYNAGGILIGSGATLDVGSLVLTSNDIDTTGGLFGAGGEIRFRGASGSTSSIEIGSGASISAAYPGSVLFPANPGGSYVALVAPRIVQNGTVSTDGSTAFVAAEQADIRINNGLFDINVLVGAEGGNVITHSGVTTGPAHEQGDVDQSRVYMVAIPKNDAVTMLVTGQVGYQDAVVAQTDPDGAVRLSAGYNITNGEIDDTPVNAAAANITVNDTLFLSDTIAHASGAFAGEPLVTPPPGGIVVPPAHLGRLVVQGSGVFIGDQSASLTVGAGRIVGATGDLAIQSGGTTTAPGNASVTVNGGVLAALGALDIIASGLPQADGSVTGGSASLSVIGGTATAGNITVRSEGAGIAGVGGPGGNGTGGAASILVSGAGASLGADSIAVESMGSGSDRTDIDVPALTGGNGTGGSATLTVADGGSLTANDTLAVNATGSGADGRTQAGNGTGGSAALNILGGTLDAPNIEIAAAGIGGGGGEGDDSSGSGVTPPGTGGVGTGGSAAVIIDGAAAVNTGSFTVYASGTGGQGGDFFSFTGLAGDGGTGGDGTGGTATITVAAGTLDTGSLVADAAGLGGQGGNVFASGSGGPVTGTGVGGQGGVGQGGTASIDLSTEINSSDSLVSTAQGVGGNGGFGLVGGNGGDGIGGTAETSIGFNAGVFAGSINAQGLGGNGGFADDGAGGNGGDGTGGTARLRAEGAAAEVRVTQENFSSGGIGGSGGTASGFFSGAATGPRGGDGGDGTGGTLEIVASGGATVELGDDSSSTVSFASAGTGGNGGSGAYNAYGPGTTGGEGGTGGAGNGGTIRLLADGGTITSADLSVAIASGGVSGTGGIGGTGTDANGADGSVLGTTGGRIFLEAAPAGTIDLGSTTLRANGDAGGRIELRSSGSIGVAELQAEALGIAAPTNYNTDTAPAGIFVALDGGSVSSAGAATFTTFSSVGVYASGNGQLAVGGDLTIIAVDQIDIRHDNRTGTAATIGAAGPITAIATNGISGAPGSLIDAGGALRLNASAGDIAVDRLHGADIYLQSLNDTTVGHAEADNDFFANAQNFATGLNSIITGGNINIFVADTVDLGNSSAGGYVSALAQAITFNAIEAGSTVSLFADGATGSGITGGDITAGGDISLIGQAINLTGTAQTPGSLTAFTIDGDLAIASSNIAGDIELFVNGDVSGTYRAGGNVNILATGDAVLEADAAGTYVSSAGIPSEGYVFVDADGDATLTDSSAATMLGVRSGGATSITGGTAGEDIFVLAGTSATLANLTAGDDLNVTSGGAMTISNAATTGSGADDRSIVYETTPASGSSPPVTVLQIQSSTPDLSNMTLSAPSATINAADVSAFGNLTATAGDGISAAPGSLMDAGGTLSLNATAGDIAVGRLHGADIVLASLGDTTVVHAEADNDFFANAQNFATGLNSIITGGNIDIVAADTVDLGNSSAGGYVSALGQVVTFNAIDAGSTVSLFANGAAGSGITGGDITAGGDVSLFGQAINLTGTVQTPASLSATTIAGDLAIASSNIAGNISLFANGNVSGTYRAGGNVNIRTSGDAVVEADAAGTYVSSAGIPSEGYVFVDAEGDATLTDSSAATMLGVRSGGATSITGGTAGEDIFILAGTTATLANLTAGDDLNVTSGGAMTISNAATTGSGADDRSIVYETTPASGSSPPVTMLQIQSSAPDLSNVTLSAPSATINAADVSAFSNLTATASGTVTGGGLLEAGLAATIIGSALSLEAVTAGTDAVLTATLGGVTATGAIAAGHDVTVTAPGDIAAAEVDAGDDVLLSAGGAISAGAAFAYGSGDDDEGNGSNVVATASGAILFDGDISSANDTTLTGASIAAQAIDAGGGILLTATGGGGGAIAVSDAAAGGYFGATGQSVSFTSIDAGAVSLTAVGGAITGGTITAGDEVQLTGASITVTSVEGDASLNAQATAGAIAIAEANVAGFVDVAATGAISGAYTAGGDIALTTPGAINASVNALGGYEDPGTDAIAAGNAYLDAGGNVTLANSSAAGMLGINAGGSVTVTGAAAGEDALVIAGTTANLADLSAGDDIDVRAGGNIIANNVSATGDGPDGFGLFHVSGSGFAIGMGEGVSTLDGADIDLNSSGGSITGTGLSAGDDIFLTAAAAINLNGAGTLGLGVTGGDSSIFAQSAAATLGSLGAADDVVVDASGAVDITAPVVAGRDIAIDAGSVTTTILTGPSDNLVNSLAAGRDLAITTAGAIETGALAAARDVTMDAGTTIQTLQAVSGAGGTLSLSGNDGVTGERVVGGGATDLASTGGAINIASLESAGPVTASADSIRISAPGSLDFALLETDVGDAFVNADGNLSVATASVAGMADMRARGGSLAIADLTAGRANLEAQGDMILGPVTAANTLVAEAGGLLAVNNAIVAEQISLGSGDITIGANGRIGALGTTLLLDVRNTDPGATTFIGGTGTRAGYHIDSSEMTRLFSDRVTIFAPVLDGSDSAFVASAPGTLLVPIASVGSSAPPDVVIDDFTMTAGGSASNLGVTGSLTISTPGKARVVGDVSLTGMGDDNALNMFADDALEVILGEGSIRLSGASIDTPAGLLRIQSNDVIVATLAAIGDVAGVSTTDAIEERLAQNDGVTSDDGALYAGGITARVVGGFYVQNSGTGTDYGERRGLTFGAGGLNVNPVTAETRLVINGVHLGPQGQVTGLDTIPLLSVRGGTPSPGDFDPRSTFNGCVIANPSACLAIDIPDNGGFPVQDVIEEESNDDGSDSISLPTALITMRAIDPLTGEPLLDDPVTGAGNDDLWTPPGE